MSDITREGFTSAVAATIASVHHLYREVARLNVELREALNEEPGALISVRGSSFGKSGLNLTRVVIRDAYGVLFKPSCPTRRWIRRKTTRRSLTPKLIVVELVAAPWNSWLISHCWRSESCYTTREGLDGMTR